MKRVVVVFPSGSQIDITGKDLDVECSDYDPATDVTTVCRLTPQYARLDEVGLKEEQQADGTWLRLVGKPRPRHTPSQGTT